MLGLCISYSYWKIKDYKAGQKIREKELIDKIDKNREDQRIKNKELVDAINNIFHDHALRIHLIQRCMWINKVDEINYENIGLPESALLSIGFSKEQIIKAQDTEKPQKLRVTGDNSNIKDAINYESLNTK